MLTTKSGRIVKLTQRMADYLQEQTTTSMTSNVLDDIRPEDSASGIGRSRCSQLSNRSSQSSVSLMRLKEEQKRVELSTKAAALKERHELELRKRKYELEQRVKAEQIERQLCLDKQRLENDMEHSKLEFQCLEEEVKLKTELAISEAKAEVIDRYEGNSVTSVKRLSSVSVPDQQVKVDWSPNGRSSSMNPTVTPFVSAKSVKIVDSVPIEQHKYVHQHCPCTEYFGTPNEQRDEFFNVDQATVPMHQLHDSSIATPSQNDMIRLADILAAKQD